MPMVKNSTNYILALMLSSSMVASYITGNVFYAVLGVVFTGILYYYRKELHDLIVLAWSTSCFILHPVTLLLTALALFLVRVNPPVNAEYPERLKLWDSFIAAGVFIPVYLVNPLSLIPATIYLSISTGISFREYLRLSSIKIEIKEKLQSILLGEDAIFHFEVTANIAFLYRIMVNNQTISKGYHEKNGVIELRLSPRLAGLHEYHVIIEISDLHGNSKIRIGPYTLKVKVTPKSSVIQRVFREILEKYYHTAPPPPVWLVLEKRVPTRGFTTGGGGIGGEGSVAGGGMVGPHKGFGGVKDSLTKSKIVFTLTLFHSLLRDLGYLASRTITGEYEGAREYLPGDHPKSIHWKKSVSRGELIVKTFSKSPDSEGGGGDVIIADWDASNPVELDKLVRTTYAALFAVRERIFLLLRLPSGTMIFTRGNLVQILQVLNDILMQEEVQARFNYESPERPRIIIEREVGPKTWNELLDYYASYSISLHKFLEEKVPRKSGFVIIHPVSYHLKYQVIAEYLSKSGFVDIRIKEVPDLRYMVDRLRREYQ